MEDYKKKYENALEIARKINNGDGVPAPPDYTICEVIFPELKKSEDERIKKEIIKFLQLPHLQFVGKRNQEKWIAWLEKQGEQKFVDKCKDCNNVKGCITCTDGNQYAHITEQKTTDKIEPKKKLKNIKQTYFQKQEWTGYDEKAYEIALLDIDKSPSITKNDTIDWLKSLKNRVQPQPKQEWSEEDENMLDRLIKHFDWESDYRFDKNDCDEAQDWLKSLKERYNWKPSDLKKSCLKC